MGNFYTNITLRTSDAESVAVWLSTEGYVSVVTPALGKDLVIYDRASEAQDGSIFKLAGALSRQFQCLAMAVMNHDDDILFCELYQSGTLRDEYNSSPNYFGDGPHVGPRGGNAQLLCQLYERPSFEAEVNKVLRCDPHENESEDRYLWEIQRHRELVELLNLSPWAVGYGYRYLCNDEHPEGLDPDECFNVIPPGTAG